MICLTWNYPNSIGYPNFTPNKDNDDILRFINTTDSLREFDISYIKELDHLGMIINVYHLGDKDIKPGNYATWITYHCCLCLFISLIASYSVLNSFDSCTLVPLPVSLNLMV